MLRLYTKTVCPKCLWVKSELARSGAEAEIVNIDLDGEARERLIAAGVKSVPVLEADGTFLTDPAQMIERLGGTPA